MKDLKNETVGVLVAEDPLRAVIFDRLNIDFCCGGKQTLLEACKNQGIDFNLVVDELILGAKKGSPAGCFRTTSWLDATLSQLVDHIEHTHHKYLKKELPRLQTLADKVALVHGAKDTRLKEVATVFLAFKEEIEQHTRKEESILFPYIRKIEKEASSTPPPFGSVANPVRCMESEHADAGDALLKLRQLTDQYAAPEHACASWKALLSGLAELDKDLRIHIHKENSILFPKAIARESEHARY